MPDNVDKSDGQMRAVIASVNKRYYSAAPYEYLFQRLIHLVLAAGAPEKLDLALGDGVDLGQIRLHSSGIEEQGSFDSLANEGLRKKYVAIEATVLLHQAAETLLRLHLAHECQPSCPWIEMSRLRQPSKFKKKLRGRFLNGAADEGLFQYIFLEPRENKCISRTTMPNQILKT